MDNLHTIFSDSFIVHLRYTLYKDEDSKHIPEYVKWLINWRHHSISYLTWGYEDKRSHHPHTGLPSNRHIHIHYQVTSGKYQLLTENGFQAYKKCLGRNIREYITKPTDTGDSLVWGRNRLYICRPNINDPIHSFLYPLKQHLVTKQPDCAECPCQIGFEEQQFKTMLIQATSKYELACQSAEKSRARLEDDGMSAFYRGLMEKLDLCPKKDEFSLFSETLEYYVKKGKALDNNKIRQYVRLYQVQNELISKETYIKQYLL